MESKKLFFYELEGRGYTFQNKNWDEAKHGFEDDMLNMAWEMWSSRQAAKAQAVPEGFVLVPMVPSERMVLAVRQCYEGEAYLPYSLYSEFINQAMIEAQEQSKPVEIDRDTARYKLSMMWRGESTEINGRTVIFNESGCFDVRQDFGSGHFSQSLKATLNYLFGANQ